MEKAPMPLYLVMTLLVLIVFSFIASPLLSSAGDRDEDVRDQLIETWNASQVAQLKSKDPKVDFKVLNITHKPNSASISVSLDGARIQYQRKTSTDCREGFRDFLFSKVNGKLMLKEERTLAENCCPKQTCPSRSPGGWLLEFIDASGVTDPGHLHLLRLIDPQKGVLVTDKVGKSKLVTTKQIKKGMDFWHVSFNPLYDNIVCAESFVNSEAKCTISAGGESSYYVFRGDSQQAYLVEVGQDHSEGAQDYSAIGNK